MALTGALVLLVAQAAAASTPNAAGAADAFSPQALFAAWPERRLVRTHAPCLRSEELGARLAELAARHPARIALEEIGRSVEGRPIRLLALGTGPRRVLLWSQMHGDEPSATPALADLAATLLSVDSPEHRLVLERLTVLMVPMLNPDGTERYTRRNAQAIDVNRDALALATPEGRLLKALRDRYQPELGFNLHDQNRRTTVGETGVRATIALLAVAGDPEGTLTPGRERARRVASAIARGLAPFVPGAISRYDEDWSPRAFGDNLTRWGTPVVLIESGAVPEGQDFTFLTRLNYVALLTALLALARDDVASEDGSLYEGLARNTTGGFVDVLLAGGRLLQPPGSEPYRADLAFDLLDEDTTLASCAGAGAGGPSRIREIGDGSQLASARRLNLSGRLLVPALVASLPGIEARSWLSAEALDAVSRLGVARVRWRVAGADRAAAREIAERLAAPGRARLELAAQDDADRGSVGQAVRLAGSPLRPAGPVTLAAALAALGHGAVSSPRGESAGAIAASAAATSDVVSETARLLAALGAERSEEPPLRPDAPASLLVLRPPADGSLEPESLLLEAVFVDGREAGGGR